ncbi:uncharacterized protein EI90DRAFT_3119025 [Cantharellus anzutake]|uniref:uncharacterized protein n=1 Tax=Cantharellus anzutake TaxID=1750568 RepID=UPI001906752D|nr:uncharacterized protein EI90DRAFT_3119025 [Cantharellus anzutake]KAF8337575.1 hypothetical protein EI90DRAFT_3119025 [Cantharellus anzutake]
MAPLGISGIMPNFKNPDYFTRSHAGYFCCTLCPANPEGETPSFKTTRDALAHEENSQHVFFVQMDDTWNMKPHDWPSEPVDTSWMDPEQVKDVEHRQRVQEIPQFVGAWRSGCAEFVRDGTMLPVEAPPNPYRVKRMKKASKKFAWTQPTLADSKNAEDAEASSSSSDIDHMAVRARAMAKAKAIREKERAAQALADHAKDLSQGDVGANSPLASCFARHSYVPAPLPKTFSPVPLTSDMQTWMRKFAIDQRFSPLQMKQMREFLQLPIEAKISVIQESVYQVHALLFAYGEQHRPHQF